MPFNPRSSVHEGLVLLLLLSSFLRDLKTLRFRQSIALLLLLPRQCEDPDEVSVFADTTL